MTIDNRLADVTFAESVRRTIPRYPEGVEPGVTWNGSRGTAGLVTDGEPDWSEVLTRANLDPTTIEVVPGTVQVRTWDAAIGNGEVRTMRYYRCEVRGKRANATDMDELLGLVKRRPRVTAKRAAGSEVYVVPQGDWQAGKTGTPQMIDTLVGGIDRAAARLKVLQRRPGRAIGSVCIPFLGDLVENCDGHYDQQAFTVELDAREQRRLCLRLAHYVVDTFVPLAERIVIPVVGGNHGENRKDGKSFTTFGDNQDVEIIENVAWACAQNPARYGHVSFVIPNQELSLTLEVGGLITGFAHGHQARRGKNSSDRIHNYWQGQAFGRQPVGDAEVLFTAHSHHMRIEEMSLRRWNVQIPSPEWASPWFTQTSGISSTAGLLTVVQGPDGLRDWEIV